MNRYELENACFKINGYLLPNRKLSAKGRFHIAKDELVRNLEKDIDRVKEVTFESFQSIIGKGSGP